jgi:hypothetical protein
MNTAGKAGYFRFNHPKTTDLQAYLDSLPSGDESTKTEIKSEDLETMLACDARERLTFVISFHDVDKRQRTVKVRAQNSTQARLIFEKGYGDKGNGLRLNTSRLEPRTEKFISDPEYMSRYRRDCWIELEISREENHANSQAA